MTTMTKEKKDLEELEEAVNEYLDHSHIGMGSDDLNKELGHKISSALFNAYSSGSKSSREQILKEETENIKDWILKELES